MHEDAGREWTLEELSGTAEDRARIEREAHDADLALLRWLHAEAVHQVAETRGKLGAALGDRFVFMERIADLEIERHRLRREVEFEAKAEPWTKNSIVAPEGHGYINGGNCCECGFRTPTLRTYERHVGSLLRACACVSDEQAEFITAAGFIRPVCAVHPEAEQWQPGDPVYREEPKRGHCSNPACGATWTPPEATDCPECGAPAGEPVCPWAEGGEPE